MNVKHVSGFKYVSTSKVFYHTSKLAINGITMARSVHNGQVTVITNYDVMAARVRL